MDYTIHDFRHARALLSNSRAWQHLERVILDIDADAVLEEHGTIAASRDKAPKGGQTAMNQLIRKRLGGDDTWGSQPRLFSAAGLREWKMDFVADRVGVEVSFNHAEAIAWQLTRLNLASESDLVKDSSRIDVGVVICADATLKQWSKMDPSVGTFATFTSYLDAMRPVLHVPILLVGLRTTSWQPTNVFIGTTKRAKVLVPVVSGAERPAEQTVLDIEDLPS